MITYIRRILGVAPFALIAIGATLAAWLLATADARAQAPSRCPDDAPIDGIHRVGNTAACLVMRVYEPPSHPLKTVTVFLHADTGGKTSMDDNGTAARLSQVTQTSVVALQRPGYSSVLGTSGGTTSLKGDDYSAENVERIGAALANLRTFYPNRKILLIGHSGGAAMAALIAERQPAAADAYLLAACPCDVPAWREWRRSSVGARDVWTRSLSPQKGATAIEPGSVVRMVVGSADNNALPRFSEAFVLALEAAGARADLVVAKDADHSTVVDSPEFLDLAAAMARELDSP